MLAPDFLWLDMFDCQGGHLSGYARLTPEGYCCQPVQKDFTVREVLVNKERGIFGCWIRAHVELIPDSCLLLDVEDVIRAAAAERQEEGGYLAQN